MISFAEKEHKKVLEDHKHGVELMKEKHESQLNFARKEHQLTATKNSDTISSLEKQVLQLKQVIWLKMLFVFEMVA